MKNVREMETITPVRALLSNNEVPYWHGDERVVMPAHKVSAIIRCVGCFLPVRCFSSCKVLGGEVSGRVLEVFVLVVV